MTQQPGEELAEELTEQPASYTQRPPLTSHPQDDLDEDEEDG